MVRFIIAKRKNGKLWTAFAKVGKGKRLSEVKKNFRMSLPKNMTFRVVSEGMLKKIILRQSKMLGRK